MNPIELVIQKYLDLNVVLCVARVCKEWNRLAIYAIPTVLHRSLDHDDDRVVENAMNCCLVRIPQLLNSNLPKFVDLMFDFDRDEEVIQKAISIVSGVEHLYHWDDHILHGLLNGSYDNCHSLDGLFPTLCEDQKARILYYMLWPSPGKCAFYIACDYFKRLGPRAMDVVDPILVRVTTGDDLDQFDLEELANVVSCIGLLVSSNIDHVLSMLKDNTRHLDFIFGLISAMSQNAANSKILHKHMKILFSEKNLIEALLRVDYNEQYKHFVISYLSSPYCVHLSSPSPPVYPIIV